MAILLIEFVQNLFGVRALPSSFRGRYLPGLDCWQRNFVRLGEDHLRGGGTVRGKSVRSR